MFQYSVILGNVGQCSDRYMTCGYGRPFELPELFERVASIPGVTGIEYIGSWHLSDKTVHQIADLRLILFCQMKPDGQNHPVGMTLENRSPIAKAALSRT